MNSLSNSNVTNRLLGYQAQTSLLGKVIPKVYGLQRVAGNVIWTGFWGSTNGGKSLKSKTSSTDLSYYCGLILALCQGPIGGVLNVWSNKDEYSIYKVAETYTVSGSSPSHASAVGSEYVFTNVSVTRADSISVMATDPGSGGTVSSTTIVQTPMVMRSTQGDINGAGQYDYGLYPPSGNAHWYVSPADNV